MRKTTVKNLIVDSADKCFARFGFHKTTMDEIAKQIRKAKGVLYYYFASKEDLYKEVLKNELDGVKRQLSRLSGGEVSSLRMLQSYMITRNKLLSGATHYHEILRADFSVKYSFVDEVRAGFEAFEKGQLTGILEKGLLDGTLEFGDVGKMVDIILMGMKGLEVPLFLQGKYPEYESTIEGIIALVVRGLESRLPNF
ncbi:MAG: TetR/AcrR family transcriptional regulator [Mangrovibacterium sp.]